jgi:hypothetical protein
MKTAQNLRTAVWGKLHRREKKYIGPGKAALNATVDH